MNNENSSIYDFDLNLICDYFSLLQRQGPGSPEATVKALDFIKGLDEDSLIADLGCGSGGQTMTLAQHTPGKITGVDLFPKFIGMFNQNARRLGLEKRVQGLVGDMGNPPFEPGSLDLVWSEGAIYNVGFENGIKLWKTFLKAGGYLALTEACWFSEERPAEIHDFWVDAYPEIDTIPVKMAQLQKAGYAVKACFVLPENCWTEHFFAPQKKTQPLFLSNYPSNEMAESLVKNMRREAELYDKYKEYYGYVFFIAQKTV
ncbi:MAG: methyltransferase domain-containing protein [Bacteroidales bacterium]|jgi:SAM-dependent methyltransferase|nr:methyltransferase domain-containing protein [Bacteroidales bacterium]